MQPGCEWLNEIKTALDRAAVAVLLVTKDFLASDFIHAEELAPLLQRAEEGGVRILWVLVRDCNWSKTPLQKYQAAFPTNKALARLGTRRDAAWVTICDLIANYAAGGSGPNQSPAKDASPKAQSTISNKGVSDQAVHEVIEELKLLKLQQASGLSKRFPLGYTLFTITGAKNFIPLDSEADEFVDWNSGQQILAMSRTSMDIRLPKIVRPVTVESVSVSLERRKGARFRIDVGEPGETRAFITANPNIDGNIGPGFGGMTLSANPKYSICLEILDLEAWGDVLVLGVKRYDPIGAPKFQAIRVA